MDILILLIPIALGLGLLSLAAFMWALRSGQFDDLEGAAHRVLLDDDNAAAVSGMEKGAELPLENDNKSR